MKTIKETRKELEKIKYQLVNGFSSESNRFMSEKAMEEIREDDDLEFYRLLK